MSTHNISLPDGLAAEAKMNGINMSALLKDAINQELSRIEMMRVFAASVVEEHVSSEWGERVRFSIVEGEPKVWAENRIESIVHATVISNDGGDEQWIFTVIMDPTTRDGAVLAANTDPRGPVPTGMDEG